jgi:hypothetical protein
MLLDFATNRHGATYAYFICGGKASRRTTCTRRAVPVQLAERLVADTYKHLTISEAAYTEAAAQMQAAFDKRMSGHDQDLADLTANRARLKAESEKLIAMHFADAIDLDTLKEHQDRIRAGLADIDRRLAEHDEHYTGARAFLDSSIRLLTDAHRMYEGSNDQQRRLANQAFYSRITITDDEQARPALAEPFASIATLVTTGATTIDGPSASNAPTACWQNDPPDKAQREPTSIHDAEGSRMPTWVELQGIEPWSGDAFPGLLRAQSATDFLGPRACADTFADRPSRLACPGYLIGEDRRYNPVGWARPRMSLRTRGGREKP